MKRLSDQTLYEILEVPRSASPEEIQKAGTRAACLTQQLLAFSRRQEMDPRVLSLNQVVRELAEFLRRLIGPGGSLELDLAIDLGNIRVDPALMQQVILNLVINARDALPAGGGTVTVRTGNTAMPPAPRSSTASEILAKLALPAVPSGFKSQSASARNAATLTNRFRTVYSFFLISLPRLESARRSLPRNA